MSYAPSPHDADLNNPEGDWPTNAEGEWMTEEEIAEAEWSARCDRYYDEQEY